MKTIILDIDGTLTDMSSLEKATEGTSPKLVKYPIVDWVIKNANKYHFVYATGGKKSDTMYVLENLGIMQYFDLENSIDRDNGLLPKSTGIPLKQIKNKFADCFLITDSQADCDGAILAGVPYCKIISGKAIFPDLSEGVKPMRCAP